MALNYHIHHCNKLHGVNAAEFDLLVRDDYQGHGLGTELLQRLVTIGKKEGLDRIEAEILRDNRAMQTVAAKVGFSLQKTPDVVQAELETISPSPNPQPQPSVGLSW